MAPGGSNEYLSIRQVADRWGISERTIYKEWRNWGLPVTKIGKHIRFRARDLTAWEAEQDVPARAGGAS